MLSNQEVLNHIDTIGIRVILSLPKEPAIQKEWTWREVFSNKAPDWIFANPPPWTIRELAEMELHDPRGWLEYRASVLPGYEDTARDWLYSDNGI